jgi:hypothetical protein
MFSLLLGLSIFGLGWLSDNYSDHDPEDDTHPSLKPGRYESLSREFWDQYDKPYLGPKRNRTKPNRHNRNRMKY